MQIRNEKAFIDILLKFGIVLNIFFIGCRDKSIDSYDQQATHTINPTVSNETVVTEKDPNLAENRISRAALYYCKGKYDQAISDYNKAIEIKPSDATIFYKRGNACYIRLHRSH